VGQAPKPVTRNVPDEHLGKIASRNHKRNPIDGNSLSQTRKKSKMIFDFLGWPPFLSSLHGHRGRLPPPLFY